jgi:predicted nucleotidyltransferase component of viral defense system
MEFSRELGLRANVVEKDYVLGWLLAGIFNNTKIASNWIFKGGTCIKKCYYETYRFSEDLDFTLIESQHLEENFLVQCFIDISDWLYDASGIEIPKDLIKFEVYKNNRGGQSAQGKIGYRGPLQPRGDLPRIKLDLTVDEILVLEPVVKIVEHVYSDCPDQGIKIKCYCFEEVFAEKIRALAERERPRDLYDVVLLYGHDKLRDNKNVILETLKKKCEFKNIPVPTMESLMNRSEQEELEAEWENMLAHQMSSLPPFEQFWAEISKVMEWLNNDSENNKG